ncbi:MAG: hypothetical protein PWP74_1544 [Shewanella sp.]|nr:hypothetical protein [Shewanella sp.]
MMKNHKKSLLALVLLGLFGLSACTFDGDDGKDGADGAPGTPGADGQNGQDGQDAGSVVSTVYKAGDVTISIDPAGSTIAGNGVFALKFTATAKNQAGQVKPLTGISEIRLMSATAVTNATHDGPAVYWQNNGVAAGNGTSMYCTLTGTRGSSNACTITEDPATPGSYTGTWAHDGAAPIMNATDDLNAPHRIGVRITNLTDADGNKLPDYVWSNMTYVPATGEVGVASGKDTVANQACMNCHGENPATGGIAAPIGHRNQNVENCVLCHTPALQPNADDAAKGYVFDLPAMIHRIHGGEHLAKLSTYGFKQTAEWAEIPYPAPLDQCTVCHSTEEGKTSWETPNRAACSGCHSNIDWATGEGHSEFNLAQADDSQCAACHSTGALAPINAHKVGKRAEVAGLLTVDFTSATKAASTTPGNQDVTIKANVTFNGAPLADVTTLNVLNKVSTLIGNVNNKGEVTRWGTRPNLNAGTAAAGVLTLTATVTDAQATGTIYVGTEANFCVSSDEKIVACTESDLMYNSDDPVGATSTVKFFDLDGNTAVAARFADPVRITVSEAKCNACHTSLDYIKGNSHGVYKFDQCMDCHNNNYAGSYHPDTQILTLGKNAEGNIEVQSAAAGSATFHNRDLVTVAHRFHSGNMNSNTTEVAGVFLDNTGELHGYPAPSSDCSVCHKDGAKLFAEDGGLTSGKRSIAVTGGYISPVAESCRSCHTSGAALAHFKSNGATTDDAPDSTADLPIESCSTCHAQGKSYGIDKFHIMK